MTPKQTTAKKIISIDKAKKSQKPMKGREIIVKSLENEGCEVLFGYPGGTSMEIHQALTQSKKIRMVLPRHEQGGALAAGGYAR
ncbi:MAG: thiamine pyrophosphate-binding protein, partial [Nitrospinaceae bacterium]